ncbi:MAG: hypothetical protein HRT55_15585 [Colwellia sp.]|nr:hypothetical protein [Colwellia sp.]NQZ27729.1 hypothetical protein [Colwellia sp.]
MTLSICPKMGQSSNAYNSAKYRPVSPWSWQNVLHFLKDTQLFTIEHL